MGGKRRSVTKYDEKCVKTLAGLMRCVRLIRELLEG
jgi:hypothetical protein